MSKHIGRLHVITDTTLQHRYSAAELAAMAVDGGADTIQYRSKQTNIREVIDEAAAVRDVCARANVMFIVNDRVDVCMAVEADGVHLGRDDMPVETARRILGPLRTIGGTVRGVEHLQQALRAGADYVGLGPVFATTTKQVEHAIVGVDTVREVSEVSPVPVIAIAGIALSNVASVIEAGAYGVAVIRAVCASSDVYSATRALRDAIDRAAAK